MLTFVNKIFSKVNIFVLLLHYLLTDVFTIFLLFYLLTFVLFYLTFVNNSFLCKIFFTKKSYITLSYLILIMFYNVNILLTFYSKFFSSVNILFSFQNFQHMIHFLSLKKSITFIAPVLFC